MALDIERDRPLPFATDGQIAAMNLESARRYAWVRFLGCPCEPGRAETVLGCERLSVQFLGDIEALDRLELLAAEFASVEDSFRAALLNAEVASGSHRFRDARDHVTHALLLGAPANDAKRQLLTIDQACGVELDAVVEMRRELATASQRLEDLVPLGAALVDIERFDEASVVYERAFWEYCDVSPFSLAWVAFQLGILWGELVPEPNLTRAADWYQRALGYLPLYTKARVHLAEIFTSQGQYARAKAILMPALSSCDPEVRWRLADVLIAQGRFGEAESQLETARLGFEGLLKKHPLGFADHGAEFYAGSGDDLVRALALAHVNVANRPTRRAVRQMEAIAARMRNAQDRFDVRDRAQGSGEAYAMISRMRVIASPPVVKAADDVLHVIVDTYSQSNRTFDDLRDVIRREHFDPLKGFSEDLTDDRSP